MEDGSNILLKRYELGRKLGQGAYAKVYYARSLVTGQSVAIKMLAKDKITSARPEEKIRREIDAMRLVKHPNVLQIFEVMATKNKIYLVLEYAKGGDLYDKVAKGKLEEHVARRYFQQLINAVDYCHSRGVYHRDLKPENLLLDGNDNLKVSDFGFSAIVDYNEKNVLLQTICGTEGYYAPEVIKGHEYNGAKADIWSCGVILFVLLTGRLPFQNNNLLVMYNKMLKSEYRFPGGLHFEVRRLIASMLDPNPQSRISIARIRNSSWFRRGLDKEPPDNPDTEKPTAKQESDNLTQLNAFDIISLSAGLHLSSMLDDSHQRKEARFIANKPTSAIVSELENMAESLNLKVRKKLGPGALRMEGLKRGRKGVVAIDAEIFQVTPYFHLVEIRQSNGDTLEYQKLLKEDIRPALKDIFWAWPDDEQQKK